MKKLLFVCGIVALLSSCSTQKTLLKKQQIYTYNLGHDQAGPSWYYTKYSVIKQKKVKITDNLTYLIIKDDPAADTEHYRSMPPVSPTFPMFPPPPVWKNENIGNSYFSEPKDDSAKGSLWYRDGKIVLQTASIPLKIRSAIHRPELLDSIPGQTETGFNVGFLVGYKFAWNRFRSSSNVFGQTTGKYSVTPGAIISFGAADLSAVATRPKIIFPRKAPMITLGGSVVFGFNSVNIGYAFGWDHAVGPSAPTWIYQGKMWNGIIVSLDLIK